MDLVERISSFISVESPSIHCSGARHGSTTVSTIHRSLGESVSAHSTFNYSRWLGLLPSLVAPNKLKVKIEMIRKIAPRFAWSSHSCVKRFWEFVMKLTLKKANSTVCMSARSLFSPPRSTHISICHIFAIKCLIFCARRPDSISLYVLCIIRHSNTALGEQWRSALENLRKVVTTMSVDSTELRSY